MTTKDLQAMFSYEKRTIYHITQHCYHVAKVMLDATAPQQCHFAVMYARNNTSVMLPIWPQHVKTGLPYVWTFYPT